MLTCFFILCGLLACLTVFLLFVVSAATVLNFDDLNLGHTAEWMPRNYGGLVWQGIMSVDPLQYWGVKYGLEVGTVFAPPVSKPNAVEMNPTYEPSVEAPQGHTFTLLSLYVSNYNDAQNHKPLNMTAYDAAGNSRGRKQVVMSSKAFQLVDLTAEPAFIDTFKVTFSNAISAIDDMVVVIN